MSYSPVKFAFFLKSRLIFNIFYCFCMFANILQTLRVYNSRISKIRDAKLSGYCFYMNTNVWENFQTCISVPLSISPTNYNVSHKVSFDDLLLYIRKKQHNVFYTANKITKIYSQCYYKYTTHYILNTS